MADILHADAVVVGAGTSGCYFAWRLGQAGYRTIVLEKLELDQVGQVYPLLYNQRTERLIDGHLRTALDVQEALGIRRIHFVPLKEAVHRDQPGTPAELRCALVQAAVADQPGFVMDDRELHRHGPSWSYYTLESFRREYAVEPLAFIMGGDAFNGFLSWHRPLEILDLAHIVVMQRPDAKAPHGELKVLLEERLTAVGADVRRYMKPTFAKPAPVDLRHEISTECQVVSEALDPIELLLTAAATPPLPWRQKNGAAFTRRPLYLIRIPPGRKSALSADHRDWFRCWNPISCSSARPEPPRGPPWP